jgi:serine/threonine protein kinase
MIQELDFQDCETFDSYFEEIKKGDADRWAKVDPKEFGDDSKFFAVKTFLTEENIIWKKQRGATKKLAKKEYHPVDVELPYPLVEATAAIDLWSFGVVLYSLVTGSSLFAVNRDDDLYDATAMKDLCEWNETKRAKKLKLINDPLAYKLLSKILSPKPLDRYHSMELLLRDDYFDAKNLTEHFVDYQKKMEDAIRKQTVELRTTQKSTNDKISGSISVILTAIFEATEVQTPTCFVILPENLPSSSLSNTGDMTEAVASKMDYIGDVLDKATDCIASPFDFAAAFLKSKFIESTMFLYRLASPNGLMVESTL